jgi:hypothetical protein
MKHSMERFSAVVRFLTAATMVMGLFLASGLAASANHKPGHESPGQGQDRTSPADHSQDQGDKGNSQNGNNDGKGANTDPGPYTPPCDPGTDPTQCGPSGNGNGNGQAGGKPCAGCVGNADDKNPRGQLPGPQDGNNGYECDGNHGIARGNPAHTGCTPEAPPTPTCEELGTCPLPPTCEELDNCPVGGVTEPPTGGDRTPPTGGDRTPPTRRITPPTDTDTPRVELPPVFTPSQPEENVLVVPVVDADVTIARQPEVVAPDLVAPNIQPELVSPSLPVEQVPAAIAPPPVVQGTSAQTGRPQIVLGVAQAPTTGSGTAVLGSHGTSSLPLLLVGLGIALAVSSLGLRRRDGMSPR